MAECKNKVILRGRLGADPEVKVLPNGNKIAKLRMVTSERWKDKNTGEKKEKSEWHQIVIWNEHLINKLKNTSKGDELEVEGAIQTRKWTDSEGKERYSTEIVLQGFKCELSWISSKGGLQSKEDREDSQNESQPKSRPASQPRRDPEPSYDDSEVPF